MTKPVIFVGDGCNSLSKMSAMIWRFWRIGMESIFLLFALILNKYVNTPLILWLFPIFKVLNIKHFKVWILIYTWQINCHFSLKFKKILLHDAKRHRGKSLYSFQKNHTCLNWDINQCLIAVEVCSLIYIEKL